jgi:hypothetical protein
MQIARRLRAAIVNLADTLPAQRHPASHQELNLLDRMIGKLYALAEDLALARIPDSQGLGGSSGAKALAWRNANIYKCASDFPSVAETQTK